MYTTQRIVWTLCAALLAFGASGCLLSGNYHSAKTLSQGESAVGLTFSATTYELADNGVVKSITIPSLIPELTYHVGVSDDVEVGGRVGLAQLAIEGDLKYRFYQSDNLHLAIAPAIGAQSFVIINGMMLRVPVIATLEISDNLAITGSLFGRSTRYSFATETSDFGAFSGSLVSTGGSIGIEISGSVFAIRPSLEFASYVASFDNDSFEPFNTVSLTVHLAFIGGREKKQLDRIERKLDEMRY